MKGFLFVLFILGIVFAFGGRVYQEIYIRDLSTAWQHYARNNCAYLTLLDTLPMNGCCLETVKQYNKDGALPRVGDCGVGYEEAEWIPMCSTIRACYPEGATQPVPTKDVKNQDVYGESIQLRH